MICDECGGTMIYDGERWECLECGEMFYVEYDGECEGI